MIEKREYQSSKILSVYSSEDKAKRLVKLLKERDQHELALYINLAKMKHDSLTKIQKITYDRIIEKDMIDEIYYIEKEIK